MEIELSIAVTDNFGVNRSAIFFQVSNRLNQFIKGKRYGDDIEKIKVGFIMVFDRPGYELWYKPKKISYTDYSVTKSRLTAETIEINKQLSFEIRLNENSIGSFLNSNETDGQNLIIQQVANYLSTIKQLPKKITDFDKEKFVSDLKQFQECIIKETDNGA